MRNGVLLSAEQQAFVDHPGAHKVLVAPPGSGKTQTAAGQVAAWLAQGKPCKKIWAITFTRRAATELAARIDTPIGYAGTAAALAFELLWQGGYRFTPIDDADLRDIIEDTAIKAGIVEDRFKQRVFNIICRNPARGENASGVERLLKLVEAQLIVQKLQHHGHILPLLLHTMLNNPEFLTWCKAQVECLIWDEYQDVGPEEDELLTLLDPANTVCVGDPRQAIYGWRGASPLYMAQRGERADWCASLTHSFRCGQTILDVANCLYPDMLPVSNAFTNQGTVRFSHRQYEFLPRLIADSSSRPPIAILVRTNEIARRIAEEVPGIVYLSHKNDVYCGKDWRALYALARIAVTKSHDTDGFLYRVLKMLTGKAVFSTEGCTLRQLAFMVDFPFDWPDPVLDLTPLQFVGWYQTRDLQDVYGAVAAYSGVTAIAMTVHAAKGMEFDRVIVAGLGQGFPMGYGDLDGERATLYVAITRAKESLTLVGNLLDDALKKLLTVIPD